jgi:hypothetical protein
MEFVQKLQHTHPNTDSIFQSIRGFHFQMRAYGCFPMHIIFCLDDSSSMNDSWPSVKEAVRKFIGIRHELMSDGDLFSCVQFSHNTFVPFQRDQIETALSKVVSLSLRGGPTSFDSALKAVSGLVQGDSHVAILFMTDGESHDNPKFFDPIAVARSIMGLGSEISFFGVAFTPNGQTQTLRDIVQVFNGVLVEANNVRDLRGKFQFIAKDLTAAHAR